MAPISQTTTSPGISGAQLPRLPAEGNRPANGLHRLSGVVMVSRANAGEVAQARQAVGSSFQEWMSSLGVGLPESSRAAFAARGRDILEDILKNSFDAMFESFVRDGGHVPRQVLRDVTAQANAKAQQALLDLDTLAQNMEARASQRGPQAVDIRPQVVPRRDGAGNIIGFNVIRQAPQIENMVLRGGGAKGMGYPPALVEMENAGLLGGLKHVVGTSAGALTAMCLACGQNAQEFSEFSRTVDMKGLMGKSEDFATRYPMVKLEGMPGINLGFVRVGAPGGRALELLDRTSAQGVNSYLQSHWNTPEFQARLNQLTQQEQARLIDLRSPQRFDADRTNQMITFRDLRLMHQIDPAKFKNLTLTGWDNDTKTETYFGYEKTPDMPVAIAGRISMSFPVVFKSVSYDPGDGLGMRSFRDGGIGSNAPSEVVTRELQGQALEEAHARTAVFTFDELGKAYTVLHRSPEPIPGWRIMSRLKGAIKDAKGAISGNRGLGQSELQDKRKIHDAGPNTFVVFHGKLDTLDFGASAEKVAFAQGRASMEMLEQIRLRQNQAYAVEYENPQDCLTALTESEKHALREGGPPNPQDFRNKDGSHDFLTYSFQYALYEAAWRQA